MNKNIKIQNSFIGYWILGYWIKQSSWCVPYGANICYDDFSIYDWFG